MRQEKSPGVSLKISNDKLQQIKTQGGKRWLWKRDSMAPCYEEILKRAKKFKADVKIDEILIQKMAEKGAALIIGMKQDVGLPK
jgi:acyl-CoA synthetase (NDP forming)